MTTVTTFPGNLPANPIPGATNLPTSLVPPAIVASGGEPPADGGGLDLCMVGDLLRRRWLLITSTIVGITALSAGYALTQTPIYTAVAKIMVGVPHTGSLDLGSLVGGIPIDEAQIQNEVQLLQSRSLAHRVVEVGGLDRLPEFNPALPDPDAGASWLGQIRARVALPSARDLLERVGLLEDPIAEASIELGRAPIEDVVDGFLDNLTVWPEGRSHVISVSFESEDPRVAADGANQLAETFIEQRLTDKLASLRRTSGWLDTRLEALRADAERKEAAVEAYRSEAGLSASESDGLAADRLVELNRSLAIATAAEAEAEASWLKVQETLETRGMDALPAVLASKTIQDLRAAELIAAARRAELSRELGPRHPQMIDIQAQLDGIRQQILAETGRIVAGVSNEYDVAQSRVARIERDIAALEEQLRGRNDAGARLRVLEREAEAAQDVYRTFLTQANASGQVETLQVPDARLISAAEVPAKPSAPKRKLLVALGFVFGSFAAIALALGVELLDRRFRNPAQLRAKLRLPVLGVVPALASVARTCIPPQDQILDGGTSAFGEAVRSLRTAISMQGQGRTPRTLVLTSSVQGEGKTTLALSLGRQAALGGRKAIVIDCDLRRPRLHEGLGVANEQGTIGFLKGASFSEVVRADPHSGLHYIPAGVWQPSAPELLGGARLRELIALLQSRYELVLIDTPPLLPVSDATLVAGLVDLVLLVVGWPDARPETVEAAAERLRLATGQTPIGAVLNNVDVNRANAYGFAEVDAYRGHYGRYYAAA